MNFKTLYLTETKSKTLVIVDIQPAYEKNIHFSLTKFVQFLIDSEYSHYLYLYNGPDFGFEDESDIKYWLFEKSQLDLDDLPKIEWFEKNYAFLRNAMDSGVDDSDIIKLARYMLKRNKSDSRDLNDSDWETLEIEDLRDNGIYIPDVMDVLKKYDNYELVGGHETECLKEVELLLDILGKKYTKLRKFIF
jgi:hypothetical protein